VRLSKFVIWSKNGTWVLQVFQNGVTKVLQACYKGVTKVLQACYKGVIRYWFPIALMLSTVSFLIVESVTRVLQGCCKGVTKCWLPTAFIAITLSFLMVEISWFCHTSNIRLLTWGVEGCYKGVTGVLQGHYEM
jgi:Na+-driven multidrug efflux pump